MQPEIAVLSVCFILRISCFVQDHSARCSEHTLAGLNLSWTQVARTAKNAPAKTSRSSHDFQPTFPCHIMITFTFFTETFWWDQLYCNQPVYPFRAVLTFTRTQLIAQWRDGAFLKWWIKRSVLSSVVFFSVSYFITKLCFRPLLDV